MPRLQHKQGLVCFRQVFRQKWRNQRVSRVSLPRHYRGGKANSVRFSHTKMKWSVGVNSGPTTVGTIAHLHYAEDNTTTTKIPIVLPGPRPLFAYLSYIMLQQITTCYNMLQCEFQPTGSAHIGDEMRRQMSTVPPKKPLGHPTRKDAIPHVYRTGVAEGQCGQRG